MDQILEESFTWALWPDAPELARFRGQPAFVFGNPQAVTDRDITDVFHPRVYGYAPRAPNGRAALVLAGGGYTKLVAGYEGVEVARWLCSLGFLALVLVHRFPAARWAVEGRSGSQAPVDDAIEAMRQIRARCEEWDVAPDAIGVVGLSSGGHLAASLVSNYPREWLAPASAHANVSHRPDFLVVGYAPISTNATGRTVIPNKPPLPPPEKQALYESMQPDAQLLDNPPPAFIVYSANDAVVPVQNAHRLHEALLAKGGAAELHVFADAPHGFALRKSGRPVDTWPTLCEAWLRTLVSPASR